MKEIKLVIKDNFDLMILWGALNHAQAIGRIDLARNQTKSDKIEEAWMKECVDDFDRIMTLKAQISREIIQFRRDKR